MTNFREVKESVLLAYNSGYISDGEFVLLYDAYKSRIQIFVTGIMTDSTLMKSQMLSVEQSDIHTVADALRLPEEIVTYNGLVVGSIPALCILLKRFAFPC